MRIHNLLLLLLIPASLGLTSCSVMMYGQQVANVTAPFADTGIEFLENENPEFQKRGYRYGDDRDDTDAHWVGIAGGAANLWCIDDRGHFRLRPSGFARAKEAYAMYDGKKYVIPLTKWRWNVPNTEDGFPVTMDVYILYQREDGTQYLWHGQVSVINTNLNWIRDRRPDLRRW